MAFDDSIERKYERAFAQLGEVSPVFPAEAKDEMARMIEQIVRTDEHLADIASMDQTAAVRGGFAAEEAHAESFNLDAILKGKKFRAATDRYEEWRALGFGRNDSSTDVIVHQDGVPLHRAQIKYNGTAKQTATEMRQLGPDGTPKYGANDSLVGPSDQINPTDGSPSVGDHLERAKLKNAGTRPAVSAAADMAQGRATTRIEHDGASSQKMSLKEARALGRDTRAGREYRQAYQDQFQAASTLKHMAHAAKGAAAISAISSGVFNTVACCKLVAEGKMTEGQAVVKIAAEVTSSAADSAIKAAGVTGAQSLMVRLGGQQAVAQLAKQGASSLLRSNAVTVGVIVTIDVVKDLVRLAAGKISPAHFEERFGKNLLTTSAGVLGSSVGMGIASASTLAFAPLAGAIAGGLVAGLAMQFAIEHGIEKPYREILEDTARTRDSMRLLAHVSQRMLEGQAVFQAFLVEDAKLEADFYRQVARIDEAGDEMTKAIDKL
jgi:hypothetical protein